MKALLASLIVSAPAYSNEIDSLVNASQSIRDSFKYGIQAVGGMQVYASQGKIAPTGTVQGGKISYDQSDAYNQALAAVQSAVYTYNPGAQEYFDNQADQAMNEVNTAVDTFVEASQAVIEVVVVNQMAEDAQNRSEEHTSELQSRLHLVCRLLLEKKKKTKTQNKKKKKQHTSVNNTCKKSTTTNN